jgi:hypothetical protein
MKRKSLLLSLTFVTFAAVAACIGFLYGRSSYGDSLAVANALGRVQGFMLSTNYPAAYGLMSSKYRQQKSLGALIATDAHGSVTGIFTQGDWRLSGKRVKMRADNATLSLKTSPSFGAAFEFVREGGEWRFTGQVNNYGEGD